MWWQEESQILGTGNFQSASDFGGLNIYPHIARGMNRLINEQRDEINVTMNAFHEPGVDVLHDTVPANALPVHQAYIPRVQYEVEKAMGFKIFLDIDMTNS